MSKEIDKQDGASPIVRVDERISWGAFSYYPPLARVRAYVMTSQGKDITLTVAAEVACLERTYFSSYFHQKIGIPFTSLMSLIRIAKGAELLQQSDYPISKVADRVGFKSTRTFHRWFKRWTGLTPRQMKHLSSRSLSLGEAEILTQCKELLAHFP